MRELQSSEQVFNANMLFFFLTLLYAGWVLQGVQNLLFKAELVQATPQWVTRSPDPARPHSREDKLLSLGIHLFTHLSKVAKNEGKIWSLYCHLIVEANFHMRN